MAEKDKDENIPIKEQDDGSVLAKVNDLPEEYYKNGYEAYLKALEKIEFAEEWEKDLINSLQFRYPKIIPKNFKEKVAYYEFKLEKR